MSGTSIWVSRLLVVYIAVLFPTQSIAQGACTKAVKVTTPCEGVLLPKQAAADGLKCLKTCQKEADAKLEKVSAVFDAKLAACAAERDAEREGRIRFEKLVNDTLKDMKPEDPPFWKTNVFWGATGGVVGAAAMFLLLKKVEFQF